MKSITRAAVAFFVFVFSCHLFHFLCDGFGAASGRQVGGPPFALLHPAIRLSVLPERHVVPGPGCHLRSYTAQVGLLCFEGTDKLDGGLHQAVRFQERVERQGLSGRMRQRISHASFPMAYRGTRQVPKAK